MANRVLLETGALRISKPGIDVLSTTDDRDLVFDAARRAGYAVMAGSFQISGQGTHTVNFGQTLPAPPFVTFIYTRNGQWRMPNARYYVENGHWLGLFYGAGVIAGAASALFWKAFGGTDTFRYTIWSLDM
jgi:hypothetical protein